MSKLKIIVGTTRLTRAADRVAPWVASVAADHGSFDVEVLDLRDWPLPFFSEHFGTLGDINDPTYSEPVVKAWNRKIKDADAYIVVTGEYNHSLPGVLKNAIDSAWASFAFRNKPVAVVGYSAGIGGGIRAIEHLAQIVVETEAVPLRNTVVIPFVNDAFDDAGRPTSPLANVGLDVVLDDLAWWSVALEQARAAGELLPGRIRLRTAMLDADAAKESAA
ncbi:NAD(P)H-dependent oxidoreductase [Nonomuraea sp. SMC257]|uniref:NAD(P)H-dependent oxidoreductase n=1 Tax=Nonomuraea montanisoli TaxID=2741721 RepID=A0A7Y6M5T3_9ACTN|nr:NAD(P)H-dependent oxidoreductase [Nonomuraea montanisoli]NUW35642.1 NAD(P)H-dependent oxidoreductase [Nonomuraea montanisoli]